MRKLSKWKGFSLTEVTYRDFQTAPSFKDRYEAGEVLIFSPDVKQPQFGKELATADNEQAAIEYLEQQYGEAKTTSATRNKNKQTEFFSFESSMKYLEKIGIEGDLTKKEKETKSNTLSTPKDLLPKDSEESLSHSFKEIEAFLVEVEKEKAAPEAVVKEEEDPFKKKKLPLMNTSMEEKKPKHAKKEDSIEKALTIVAKNLQAQEKEYEIVKLRKVDLEKQLEEADKKAGDLEKQLEEADKLANQDKKIIFHLESEYEKALTNIGEVESELKKAEGSRIYLEQEIVTYQDEKETLEKSLNEERSKGEKLKKELGGKELKIEQLERALEKTKKEAHVAIKELEKKKEEVREKNKRIETVEQEIEAKKVDDARILDLKAEKEQAISEREKAAVEVEERQDEIIEYSETIKEIDTKLHGEPSLVYPTSYGEVVVKHVLPEASALTKKQAVYSGIYCVAGIVGTIIALLALSFFITMVFNDQRATETIQMILDRTPFK